MYDEKCVEILSSDGSSYYYDSQGYERYIHPDPGRSWERYREPESDYRNYGNNVSKSRNDRTNAHELDEGPYDQYEYDEQPQQRHEPDDYNEATLNDRQEYKRESTPEWTSHGGRSRSTTVQNDAIPSRQNTPENGPTFKREEARQKTTARSTKQCERRKCGQCRIRGHDSRNCPLNRYG